MPASLVNSAAGSAAVSFSFAQRQLRFFKIAIEDNSNTAVSLAAEFGSDSVTAIGGDSDNNPGVVQQVVQVLQNYGTVEHMRVGNADATDGFIFAALDVGGSATTLPAAIQADIRVLRADSGPMTALGTAGTTAGKDHNIDVRGSDVTETGLVLVA